MWPFKKPTRLYDVVVHCDGRHPYLKSNEHDLPTQDVEVRVPASGWDNAADQALRASYCVRAWGYRIVSITSVRASRGCATPEPPQEPQGDVVEAVATTLAECPVGLFMSEAGELCLKTEYSNNEGRIDAYIVSSGEFFWGAPPQTITSQRAQIVRPITITRPALSAASASPPGSAACAAAIARATCAWSRAG